MAKAPGENMTEKEIFELVAAELDSRIKVAKELVAKESLDQDEFEKLVGKKKPLTVN